MYYMPTPSTIPQISQESNQVTLSITGKLTYTDEISITQAAQVIAFLSSGSTPSSGPTRGPSGQG